MLLSLALPRLEHAVQYWKYQRGSVGRRAADDG